MGGSLKGSRTRVFEFDRAYVGILCEHDTRILVGLLDFRGFMLGCAGSLRQMSLGASDI